MRIEHISNCDKDAVLLANNSRLEHLLRMHRFRTSLTQLIQEQGWTQQGFAQRLGTDPANVSRWLSGKSSPDSSTVGKILESLPEEYQSDLLSAYLKDQIPNRFDSVVKIEAVEGGRLRSLDAEPELPEALSPELKKQVVYFARLALRWPEVRRILDLFYQVAHRNKSGKWDPRRDSLEAH
jgi:transcriptional regulator with XRE-family HTH domain